MRGIIGRVLPQSVKVALRPSRADPIKTRRLELSRELHTRFGGVVAHGPFAGLELAPEAHWGSGVYSHQLLGIYEQEVQGAIRDASARYDTFIEIGAQDGYYAIGALRAGMFQTAHCFEILEAGRKLIAENARRNGMADKLRIHGEADETLAATLAQEGVDLSHCVVLCDIEGAEFDVFTPAMFQMLKGATILIELHPFAVSDGPAKVAALTQAAAENFHVTQITTGARDLSVFPELDRYSDTDRWLLCSEGRPERMHWLRLDPR
ncbi:MAG: hypothetical protein WA957_13610 [Alteraurantiacibacter sp.]